MARLSSSGIPSLDAGGSDWDAVILAGGRASRLGGIDKTALVYAGHSLLEHAIRSARTARRVVVVGPDELREKIGAYGPGSASPRLDLVAETPRFGGPVAALAAGVQALTRGFASQPRDVEGAASSAPQWIAVIAGDQPRVEQALPLLLSARGDSEGGDGVIAEDSGGRRQFLLAVYRARALVDAIGLVSDRLDGCSMRTLTAPLGLTDIRLDAQLCVDVDDPEQARDLGIILP